jgi:transcriptional regulator with XRE-family HTH domain
MLHTPETIHRLLQDRNCAKVSAATGLSHATVNKLASGLITNPTADTLQKLTDYFEAQQHGPITESN